MSIAIIDVREWQRTFDLETGKKLEISGPKVEMVKKILSTHPFPGDLDTASSAWVTDTALELIEKYNPQFAFITYSSPYFRYRFQEIDEKERKDIVDNVFCEIDRFVRISGFEPVIAGSGTLIPLQGYIDLSHLDGLAIATSLATNYIGVRNPSPGDLEYIEKQSQVEMVVTRKDLLELFNGNPEEGDRLPDYFVVAKEGYTYRATGTILRRSVNIPAHNSCIPVSTGLGDIDDITGIRSLIEKDLPDRKTALIVIEGIGEEDFPSSFITCKNGPGWYNYEPGDLQFFAMNMGKHNFMNYPRGSLLYEDIDNKEKYPFSGYFRDIATDTIGSRMGIRRIAVGNRSMITHATTGADICIECFARGLANQGCMGVICDQ